MTTVIQTDVSVHALDLGVTKNAVALGQACADVDILVNNAGARNGPADSTRAGILMR